MTEPREHRGISPPASARDIAAPREVEAPLVHEVRVGWADCDPAQIAYTANIPGWMLASLDAWYAACLGVNWFEINLDHGIGTPFVNLSMDFHSPITPREPLACTVFVTRVGKKSVSHRVVGHQGKRHCFTGQTTSAFVDAGGFRSIDIPPNMRRSIEHYRAGQGAEDIAISG